MNTDKTYNILVAEDDYAIALALKTIIQKNIRCNLAVVKNGQEAIDVIRNNSFDLIISDWNMPIKTGQDVLEFIRKNKTTQHLPFIMLTARADRDSVIGAAMFGVTHYVHKPFNREDLLAKIHLTLNLTELPTDENIKKTQTDATERKSKNNGERRKIIDVISEKLQKNDFSLPTSTQLTQQAIELIKDPDSTIEDIANLIRKDVTITARLIAISNNGIYRGSKDNITLEAAIKRLGMQETSNYLWMLANSAMFKSGNIMFQTLLNNIKQHSLAVAETAQLIAQHLRLESSSNFYYLGLLHDLGSVLVVQILEDMDKEEPIHDYDAIYQSINKLHSQFGSVLLNKWELPAKSIEIALHHEHPPAKHEYLDDILVINLGNCVANELGYGIREQQSDNELDTGFDEQGYLQRLQAIPSSQLLGVEDSCFINLSTHVPDYITTMGKLL